MARTIKPVNLESPTARSRLKRGRQAHWQPLQSNCHFGYRRSTDKAGQWKLRRYLGPTSIG
jgi:hypothetical protein